MDIMTHSTRNNYKDKARSAAAYKEALVRASETIEELEAELREREDRELELLDVMERLGKATVRLSGTLHGTVGDFGVGAAPDRRVDAEIYQCRPALVVTRATVIMLAANERLEELHLENQEVDEVGQDLLNRLSSLTTTIERSKDRRRRLLITGLNHTDKDTEALKAVSNEYEYHKGGPLTEEIYNIPDANVAEESEDESDEEESEGTVSHILANSGLIVPPLIKAHRRARRRYEATHGRSF